MDSAHRGRLNPPKWSQVNVGPGLMSGFKLICQSRLLKTPNPRPGELRRCAWQGGGGAWMVGAPASGSLVRAPAGSAALSLAKQTRAPWSMRTNAPHLRVRGARSGGIDRRADQKLRFCFEPRQKSLRQIAPNY